MVVKIDSLHKQKILIYYSRTLINVTLKHLRAFVAVAEEGSYTRAAQRLHLTQSSLTATIQQLERSLGLTLFDRTTRRLALSREGSEFLPVAQRLLQDFDAAVRDIRAIAERQRGHVGVAAAPSVVALILPPVIAEFTTRYPGITVAIADGGSRSIQQRVLHSEIDFGITNQWADDTGLEFRPLLRDRFQVASNVGHPVARRRRATWRELEAYPHIMLTTDTGIRAALKTASPLPASARDPLYQLSSTTAVEALLRQGLGISILPALAARLIASRHLRFTPLVDPVVEREICIITRRGRALSPAAQSMLQLVSSHLSTAQLPSGVRLVRPSRSEDKSSVQAQVDY
jgi:DNA-binding transcriptional LysR family regulator